MTNTQSPDVYLGRDAVDTQGNKIGSVGQVYVNDASGVPDWITINTGLFGMKENFAPLHGSSLNGDDLVLPFDKDVVKDSPDVADSEHIDIDEQQALSAYYQRYLGSSGSGETSDDVQYQAADAGHDSSGPSTDDAMTRSEEHLNVGTEQVELHDGDMTSLPENR